LGPAGTKVTLTILRENNVDSFDVTIERAKISVPSVESRRLDSGIAYVRLFTFGDASTEELRRVLKEQLDQNPKGLIFDLRNNGGGELQTAIEVASEFIDQGVVMYEEYGDGRRDEYKAIEGGLATQIPLVVLINEGSASASEIVAGAIQDVGRGQLVGTTSFGKGSVQNWIPLVDDEGAVRVTIARWLTPNGRTIHETGLEPDVVVEMTEEDITAERSTAGQGRATADQTE
jgi:carboxyl-terminal processing protease